MLELDTRNRPESSAGNNRPLVQNTVGTQISGKLGIKKFVEFNVRDKIHPFGLLSSPSASNFPRTAEEAFCDNELKDFGI